MATPASEQQPQRASHIDGLITRVFYLVCVPAGAIALLANPTEEGVGFAALIVFGSLLVLTIASGVLKILPSAPAEPSAPSQPSPPEPPPSPLRVGDLGHFIEDLARKNEAAEQTERDRVQYLRGLWAAVAPLVAEAVAVVNAQLADHGMRLTVSEPDFMWPKDDPNGFGVTCKLIGAGCALAYDGEQYVAASEEHLYVGGSHSWGDGRKLPLTDPLPHDIADTLAENIKYFLRG